MHVMLIHRTSRTEHTLYSGYISVCGPQKANGKYSEPLGAGCWLASEFKNNVANSLVEVRVLWHNVILTCIQCSMFCLFRMRSLFAFLHSCVVIHLFFFHLNFLFVFSFLFFLHFVRSSSLCICPILILLCESCMLYVCRVSPIAISYFILSLLCFASKRLLHFAFKFFV